MAEAGPLKGIYLLSLSKISKILNNTSIIDTAAGDIVTIKFNTPNNQLGCTFESDINGNAAVIKSFEPLPNGKFGPLQKNGGNMFNIFLSEHFFSTSRTTLRHR